MVGLSLRLTVYVAYVYIRTYVRRQKVFLIWTKFGLRRGRRVLHDTMVYCMMIRSKVKLKVTVVWNVRKWPISKAVYSANMHVIKILTGNYDIPRQYLNFNQTYFWYSSSFGVTWPSNLGCSTFGKRIWSFTRSRPAVQYGAYAYFLKTKPVRYSQTNSQYQMKSYSSLGVPSNMLPYVRNARYFAVRWRHYMMQINYV